ncbi:sugar transferase [Leifsonia shinshuensis]|uniref:sugar transferase n=1 Tax=Leifsonia shinshuensis TaxID=150026 RepID=UPI001F50C368|nr:sugar transferase [Leifsonia shinshuensis]MCI0157470.1 sugar transferase [Leifsonia shinshuensis]
MMASLQTETKDRALSKRERSAISLAVADAAAIVLAVTAAHVLRFGHWEGRVSFGGLQTTYWVVSTVLVLTWLIAVAGFGGWVTWPKRLNGPSLLPPIKATVLVIALLAIIALVFEVDLSRAYLAGALPIGLVSLLIVRVVCRVWIGAHRTRGRYLRRALVIGTPKRASDLARVFDESISPVGVSIVATAPVETVGRRKLLLELIAENDVDVIVLTEERAQTNVRQLIWDVEGSGAVVWLSVDVPELAAPRAEFHPIERLPIIEVEPADRSITKRRGKRAFDLVFSFFGLLVALPLIAVCALLIKLDSPGPVFFQQTRIGRDGKEFAIHKLRTMRIGAEREVDDLRDQNEGSGPLFKIKDDPRVTRIGRLLRKTSIDEFPQLWNVLRGEMSLVGPRPPLPSEVAEYDRASLRRLIVKPGMTGLWQVNGRSDLTWEQGVRLDLFYVENWSLGGDLHIMFQTVAVMIRPNGAY